MNIDEHEHDKNAIMAMINDASNHSLCTSKS